MASISSISAWLISTTRMWVAIPRKSTTGSSTSASVVVRGPKPVALTTSASATIAADSAPRKIVVRLYASFHSSDRCPIRLQCSVARIATASGPSGWPPAGVEAAVPAWAAAAAASPGPGALPVLSVASMPLLGRGGPPCCARSQYGGECCPFRRRPSVVCVGQGDHAVAALGGGDQAQVRALAGAEQRGPAAHQDRVDDKAQLVDQAVLEQRLGELAVTVDHQVPVPLLLELPHRGEGIAGDDRRVVPVRRRQGGREDVLAHLVDPLQVRPGRRRKGGGEVVVGVP